MKVISAKGKEEDMSQCVTVKKFWFEWFVSAIKARLVNCLEETVGVSRLRIEFWLYIQTATISWQFPNVSHSSKNSAWYVFFHSNFCHPFNIRMKRITLTGFYALSLSFSPSLSLIPYPLYTLAFWRLSNYETP